MDKRETELFHAFAPAGGNQSHKYLAKLPVGGGRFRYVYTQAELNAARGQGTASSTSATQPSRPNARPRGTATSSGVAGGVKGRSTPAQKAQNGRLFLENLANKRNDVKNAYAKDNLVNKKSASDTRKETAKRNDVKNVAAKDTLRSNKPTASASRKADNKSAHETANNLNKQSLAKTAKQKISIAKHEAGKKVDSAKETINNAKTAADSLKKSIESGDTKKLVNAANQITNAMNKMAANASSAAKDTAKNAGKKSSDVVSGINKSLSNAAGKVTKSVANSDVGKSVKSAIEKKHLDDDFNDIWHYNAARQQYERGSITKAELDKKAAKAQKAYERSGKKLDGKVDMSWAKKKR